MANVLGNTYGDTSLRPDSITQKIGVTQTPILPENTLSIIFAILEKGPYIHVERGKTGNMHVYV